MSVLLLIIMLLFLVCLCGNAILRLPVLGCIPRFLFSTCSVYFGVKGSVLTPGRQDIFYTIGRCMPARSRRLVTKIGPRAVTIPDILLVQSVCIEMANDQCQQQHAPCWSLYRGALFPGAVHILIHTRANSIGGGIQGRIYKLLVPDQTINPSMHCSQHDVTCSFAAAGSQHLGNTGAALGWIETHNLCRKNSGCRVSPPKSLALSVQNNIIVGTGGYEHLQISGLQSVAKLQLPACPAQGLLFCHMLETLAVNFLIDLLLK